jgi:hypothetical protein
MFLLLSIILPLSMAKTIIGVFAYTLSAPITAPVTAPIIVRPTKPISCLVCKGKICIDRCIRPIQTQ